MRLKNQINRWMTLPMPPKISQTPRIVQYMMAIIVALVALSLSLVLRAVTHQSPFLFYVAAVTFSAWYGGLGPGLLTTLISVLFADYFLIEPVNSIFDSGVGLFQLVVFAFVAFLVSWTENHRRESEEALQQTQHELQAILQSAADGIMAQDASGKVIFANQSAARLLDRDSPQEIMGETPTNLRRSRQTYDENGKLLPPEQYPVNRVFAERTTISGKLRLRGTDTPSERWISIKATPIYNDEGEVQMAVSVFRDITEEHKAETLREENARFLRQILDAMPIFVGVMKPDGTLTEANRMALNAASLSAQDVMNKPLPETYWWAYADDVKDRLWKAIERARKGEVVRYDVALRVSDKRMMIVDFILSPMFDIYGHVTHLIPAAIDISERKKTEEKLMQSTLLFMEQRRRLDLIVANVPGIVYEGKLQPEGGQQMMFVSPYMETMLGYPPEAWLEDPAFFQKIIHPDDLQSASEQTLELYQSNRTGIVSFRMYTRDGRLMHAEATFATIRNEDGMPIGTCGIIMDVSERKQFEQALSDYAEELRRSNQELEQFAYIASHDLQEPLRMVTSYLQLIEQRYEDKLDADGKEFIGYAVDGSTRMKRLITDLLTYSRVQRGKGDFQKFSLRQALDEALHDLQLMIQDSGAVITYDDMPEVTANAGQMAQVFQNLIGNAIKFRGKDAPVVHISASKHGGEWRITVKDNGIGIDPQFNDRIFVIFQRLHAKGEYSGTGIGLAICKKIVEQHGGTIRVESAAGQGAEFIFTLPTSQRKRVKTP